MNTKIHDQIIKALNFYANEDNWKPYDYGVNAFSNIDVDMGKEAKQALVVLENLPETTFSTRTELLCEAHRKQDKYLNSLVQLEKLCLRYGSPVLFRKVKDVQNNPGLGYDGNEQL